MTTLFKSFAAICLTVVILPSIKAEDVPASLLKSPDRQLQVRFQLDPQGRSTFQVLRQNVVLMTGTLGLEFADSGSLSNSLKIFGTQRISFDETYGIAVGKTSSARDHHNELIVSLVETQAPQRKLDIAFRAFDDGVAFRYQLPKQERLNDFVLLDERTTLSFPGDPIAHILPLNSFTTAYEKYYQTMPISKIDATTLIGLPLLMQRSIDDAKPIWLTVTEADLTDYAGMYLATVKGEQGMLISQLSPLPGRGDNAKVLGQTPFATPWRVLMVADNPGRFLESNIIFHLNPPCKIAEPSWIKPGKTTFPWWNHYVVEGVDFKPGVNTATMKHYIDFCSEHGIPYHSLDGLDIAWYDGPIQPKGPTDVTTPAPSIDMPELLRYAKEKGVRLRLWMHWKALKPQLDEAFAIYEKWGIEGVMIDFMNRDDQEMVQWYHEVAEKAAKHHLTVTWHGAYKPTGMERTWPNSLSYEAVLNQEYNKWQPRGVKGTPPSHNLDVAFIRNIAGPLDYHHGGMRNLLPNDYQFRDVAPPVQGSRGHQLAMYVVYLNHLPMMADYPAAYRGQPGLDFLVTVPTTWDETRVLHAELGKCIVVARRKGNDWYLGGMTADKPCTLDLPLKFLGQGSTKAKLYLDDAVAGPTHLKPNTQTLSATDSLPIEIPAFGGFAAELKR